METLRLPDALQRLVDRCELLVAGQLLYHHAFLRVENNEILNEVQEVALVEDSVQEDVLRRWLFPEFLFQLFDGERPRILPSMVITPAGADSRKLTCLFADGRYDLVVREKVGGPCVLILVPFELLDPLFNRHIDCWALVLNHTYR